MTFCGVDVMDKTCQILLELSPKIKLFALQPLYNIITTLDLVRQYEMIKSKATDIGYVPGSKSFPVTVHTSWQEMMKQAGVVHGILESLNKVLNDHAELYFASYRSPNTLIIQEHLQIEGTALITKIQDWNEYWNYCKQFPTIASVHSSNTK